MINIPSAVVEPIILAMVGFNVVVIGLLALGELVTRIKGGGERENFRSQRYPARSQQGVRSSWRGQSKKEEYYDAFFDD